MALKDLDFTEDELDEALFTIATSPSKFCSVVLDFKPFPYQGKLLEDPSKSIVICAGRQVGKSLVIAARALWFAFVHPGTNTYIIASTQRQSMLMFEKLLDYVDDSELIQESVTRKTRTQLRFSNGSKIVALPCGRKGKTLRGATAHLIIVDEAAFVPEEVILSVMIPMLATTDGTIILMSTPFDREHFFFRAFNSLRWSRYKFKTSDNPTVTKDFLDRELENLGERRFAQEFLAEFVDDEETYFPMALLRSCMHICDSTEGCSYCNVTLGKTKPSGELYGGYDPGGLTDPAAFVVVQKNRLSSDRKNPVFKVVLTKTFQAKKSETKEEQDVYTKFTVEVADIHKELHLASIAVDSTGIGRPIVEHCKELKLPIEALVLMPKLQEEVFSNLKILLEQKKIELPDNIELLSNLNCITAKRTRIGGYSFDHPKGSHDDLAYALALAVWKAGKGRPVIAASFS